MPEHNRTDLTDLDNAPSAGPLGGHAPGSASQFPAATAAPQPANPAPAPFLPFPATATTGGPPPDAELPERPEAPVTAHPALGPQFLAAHAAVAVAQTVKRGVARQYNAATPPPTHVQTTTGWQHS